VCVGHSDTFDIMIKPTLDLDFVDGSSFGGIGRSVEMDSSELTFRMYELRFFYCFFYVSPSSFKYLIYLITYTTMINHARNEVVNNPTIHPSNPSNGLKTRWQEAMGDAKGVSTSHASRWA
jgi:hypothetical protein